MQYLPKAESAVRWCTFLLFFLVPFFFIPVPWVGIAQAKALLLVVVVVIGFLAWIAMSLKESQFTIPTSSLLLAALLVPLAYFVSAIVTGPSWDSLVGDGSGQDTVIGFALWYLALFLAAVVLGAQNERPILALRLLLAGTGVLLAVQTAHLVFPAFTFGGALPFPASSLVGSWHDLAIYLSLSLFLALALLPTGVGSGVWRYVASIVALVSFALLIIINYTDAWVALAGISLLYVVFIFLSKPTLAKAARVRMAFPFLLLASLSVVLYFGAVFIQRSLPPSLQITQVEVRPSWEGTLAIGREVFAQPTQLFFGSGPNSFSREWGRYKPLSVNETQFWNTDFYYGIGFIPTSLVTTGIAGLIAWLALCVALLSRLAKLFREAESASRVRATLVLSATFLTAYHIVYVPGPTLSLLAFLIVGTLIAEEMLTGALSPMRFALVWETWRGKITAVALSLCGLVFLFGGVQLVRAVVSDVLVNRAVAIYRATGNIGEASRSVAIALIALPGSDKANRAGVELGLLQFAALAAGSDGSSDAQAALQGTLNATIQHGLAAVAIDSSDYQNWITLARLYGELAGAGVAGAEVAARDAYTEAASKSPTSPLPHLGLAQLDLLRGDEVHARENLEKAIAIKSNLAPAHFLLSQIDARANRLPEALQHATIVVQIAPEDPLGWYNIGTILYASGDYVNSASTLERAVSLQENYANALFLLGLSYYRLDRVEDSLRALRAVAVTNPDDTALKTMIKKIANGEDPFAQ